MRDASPEHEYGSPFLLLDLIQLAKEMIPVTPWFLGSPRSYRSIAQCGGVVDPMFLSQIMIRTHTNSKGPPALEIPRVRPEVTRPSMVSATFHFPSPSIVFDPQS
jgi:hypothetical protein